MNHPSGLKGQNMTAQGEALGKKPNRTAKPRRGEISALSTEVYCALSGLNILYRPHTQGFALVVTHIFGSNGSQFGQHEDHSWSFPAEGGIRPDVHVGSNATP